MAIMKLCLAFFLFMTACSTSSTVVESYDELLRKDPKIADKAESYVVFLIDGFSVADLRDALENNRAHNIARFFQVPETAGTKLPLFPQGRASFPTLTYPNLASILTAESISQNDIIGNRVVIDSSVVNYESVLNWDALGARLKNKTVFAKLREAHQVGVSYSYPFSDVGAVEQGKNAEAAINYASKDFAGVDAQTLASLHVFLSSTKPNAWPKFFFVHLIGVDALSHEFGPQSEEAQKYIGELDKQFLPIFRDLRSAEGKAHAVHSILTADHGFVEIKNEIKIDGVIKELDPKITVLSDNRIASLRFPISWSSDKRKALGDELLSIDHIEWTATKIDSKPYPSIALNRSDARARIELKPATCFSGKWASRVSWTGNSNAKLFTMAGDTFACPDNYELNPDLDNLNFMIPALIEYFMAPSSPDMLLLPDLDSEFSGAYKGNHGGLTPQETFVPLLRRNAELPVGIIPTSQLLRYLKLMK